jgi:hypothetical protein
LFKVFEEKNRKQNNTLRETIITLHKKKETLKWVPNLLSGIPVKM